MTRIRRAGARWRVVAHSVEPRGRSGHSWHVGSHESGPDTKVEADGQTWDQRHVELAGTDLDEMMIGRFFCMEQIDTGIYVIDIAGVEITVKADRDGRPEWVVGVSPDGSVKGCTYHLDGGNW